MTLTAQMNHSQRQRQDIATSDQSLLSLKTGLFGLYFKLSPEKNLEDINEQNRPILLQRLKHSLTRLDGWIDFYDFALFVTPILAALIVSIAAILKLSIARGTGTTEDENTAANITIDALIEATPIIAAFFVAVFKYIRDKHLTNKEELEASKAVVLGAMGTFRQPSAVSADDQEAPADEHQRELENRV